jgi:hypothetical protein
VHESIAVQERDPNYHGPILWDYENWNVIHRNDEYDKEFPGINGTDQDGKQKQSSILLCFGSSCFLCLLLELPAVLDTSIHDHDLSLV